MFSESLLGFFLLRQYCNRHKTDMLDRIYKFFFLQINILNAYTPFCGPP